MQHGEIMGYRVSLEEKRGGGGVDHMAAEVPRRYEQCPSMVHHSIVSVGKNEGD